MADRALCSNWSRPLDSDRHQVFQLRPLPVSQLSALVRGNRTEPSGITAEDAKGKLKLNEKDTKQEKQSIYDILINVGIILDKQLNPEVVTLYELGKLQELAIKKIEAEQKNIS